MTKHDETFTGIIDQVYDLYYYEKQGLFQYSRPGVKHNIDPIGTNKHSICNPFVQWCCIIFDLENRPENPYDYKPDQVAPSWDKIKSAYDRYIKQLEYLNNIGK